ncbi:MAG: hypothetical protein SAJ12_21315, partial [Jaaginema sp. PMC 1079.18]|nr:hypothetical protein [Jaaginema sp. PMC 1079.18]
MSKPQSSQNTIIFSSPDITIERLTEQLCTQRDTNFDLVQTNSQSIRDLIASLHQLNNATQSHSQQIAAQQQTLTEFAQALGKMSDRIEKQHQQTQHQLAQRERANPTSPPQSVKEGEEWVE